MPSIMMTADEFRAVLYATEDGGDLGNVRKFSYAGGDSSYSFGVAQFDVRKRLDAQAFLRENGFSQLDVEHLSRHGGLSSVELQDLDAKLRAIPDATLNAFTDAQLQRNVDRIDQLVEHLKTANPPIADAIVRSKALQLSLADYDNQFTITGIGSPAPANGLLAYLEGEPVRRHGEALQLGATLTRQDVQDYIDGTGYAQANPRAVHNREQRLVGALARLGVNVDERVASETGRSLDSLAVGARGGAVAALQSELTALGYMDSEGRSLAVDGVFGKDTDTAVRAFQHDHGVKVDGVVGHATREALGVATREARVASAAATPETAASLLDYRDPAHPQNPLYVELQGLFPHGTSEARLCQATAACHRAGIDRPDELASVIGTDDTVYFGTASLWGERGQMDISQPAPSIRQTMQQAQQFDQQQARLAQAQVQSVQSGQVSGISMNP